MEGTAVFIVVVLGSLWEGWYYLWVIHETLERFLSVGVVEDQEVGGATWGRYA